MHVDAVLVIGVHVLKIVGEAERSREFVSGLRIEVSIGAADIDRIVADAEIGESARIVAAGRQVTRGIDEEIVDALIPAKIKLRHQIAEAGDLIGSAARNSKAESDRARRSSVASTDTRFRPYGTMRSTLACPPSTGVANM